jgi:hypothetical protein
MKIPGAKAGGGGILCLRVGCDWRPVGGPPRRTPGLSLGVGWGFSMGCAGCREHPRPRREGGEHPPLRETATAGPKGGRGLRVCMRTQKASLTSCVFRTRWNSGMDGSRSLCANGPHFSQALRGRARQAVAPTRKNSNAAKHGNGANSKNKTSAAEAVMILRHLRHD